MISRLGKVLYWLGCGVAVLLLLLAAVIVLDPGNDAPFWIGCYIALAVGAWLLGRAARYILAGR